MRAGSESVDEILPYIPQLGAVAALAVATTIAIKRAIKSDGEYLGVIKAKDDQLARLEAEIARKDARIAILEAALATARGG